MEKKHFMLKLIPPRPTFSQDMTEDERNIMRKHVEYWTGMMNKGFVIVYGPVFDPKGGYGLGIIEVENEEQAKIFAAKDPAVIKGLGYYEIYPMKAITPKK